MKHSLLPKKENDDDYRILERWLREAATLLQGIRYYAPDYRPFEELEVPGVSLLLGAAASAGYYPISEYQTQKRKTADKRRVADGRGDLWFVAGTESYAFEFKRAWNRSTESQLHECMRLAINDAERIEADEADHYFGAVLAPVFDASDIGHYTNFSGSDYIGILADKEPELFLFISKVAE
ncbi:hypothetical protein P8Q88_10460 [Qipengyuania sp. XHP0207]|uniref:hypothetical protein n=1 Tax=Qipengyuania sp. XHP0207 TaxID=3038078 RepID=UPI00241E0611|nr:hypothetical protein [Qipengyuania sp. XHP0207]MDG5748600.1 hypothetical protein [Qipengyuania sp. XHP0207]